MFKNIVFLNNRKCKSFVNDVIKLMSHEDLEKITVFDKNRKKVLAVDLSVYNKNQCFRKVIVTLPSSCTICDLKSKDFRRFEGPYELST